MRHKAGVMSNKPAETLYQLVKLIALALCVALFLLLMSGIWDKFISEETTRSIKLEIQEIEEKTPPCVTFCPYSAFKRPGMFPYSTLAQ